MSPLQTALEDYLLVRRALGFKLYEAGLQLQQFLDFLETAGAQYITTNLAFSWAVQPVDVSPNRWAVRLGVVRQFAHYCAARDSRTEVPPNGLLSYRIRRATPYIYRDEDIKQLLVAARQLTSTNGLRPHTYTTLLGLYVATGLRVREPLKMDRDDVDLVNGVLTIRDTKFGKSRVIPLHPSTTRALQRYAKRRDRVFPNPRSPSFFLSERGTRVIRQAVHKTFNKLAHQVGLRHTRSPHSPRIHDFRHRLAINRLTRWQRRGIDIDRHMPALATYLGHVDVANTQWYLTATPELLRYALRRIERSEQEALS
jgi:integrase/recombinase XerD